MVVNRQGGRVFGTIFTLLLALSVIAVVVVGVNSTVARETDSAPGEKAQIWTCSMHPQIRLPAPGKCPICGMDLIPVVDEKEGKPESLREITLSPVAQKLAEVQVSPVERKKVQVTLRMFGVLDYDERRVAHITAWVPGRIEKLYVNFTGMTVSEGQPMVVLYSPELMAAEAELIEARRLLSRVESGSTRAIRDTARATVRSAREKLRLYGLTEKQIDEVLARGIPSDRITIVAPIGGTVVEKHVNEGVYVQTGTRIYTIADLSQLWLFLDAYESDVQWMRLGETVTFETVSYPGEVFSGRISFIQPVLEKKSRTVRIRVDVPNADGRLLPGMFAHAEVRVTVGDKRPPLVIPASAPLITGKRAVVYVQIPDKPYSYEGREIVLGPRVGDYYIVRYGLREGEKVVTRGNFKIDSAVQILAKPSMMTPEGGGGGMMHHHGGGSAPKSEASKGSGTVMEVPQSFTMKLHELAARFDRILQKVPEDSTRITQRQWLEIKEEISNLEELLSKIDGSELKGHARMMWDELSMRLHNDLVVAIYARRAQERAEALEELKAGMARLLTRFGVHHPGHRDHGGLTEPGVPQEFSVQLRPLVESYLSLQKALAEDDEKRAIHALEAMKEALDRPSMELLKGDVHVKWMKIREQLSQNVSSMLASGNISGIRERFDECSRLFGELVRTFKPVSVPLYEMFCPMAANGKGAIWFQSEREIHNPYFGSSMSSCGEVRAKIDPVDR